MTDEAVALPTLDAADMALIAELGVRRQVEVGEYLFREGDASYDFFVLVSAEVDIVLSVDGGENVLVHHGPGRFLGEQNMLSGLRLFVSARVVTSGEAIVVPRDQLRQLMATNPRLGDTILAAFVARRSFLLTGAAPAIRVIGSQFSPESLRVREFLTRTRVPHEWLDPDRDALVDDLLRQFGVAASDLPVVIASGSVLRRPTPGELASYLGLTVESLPGRCFDLVVVGGGPAGLAAAVYGASEGLRTLGVEMTAPGGQAGMSSRIENYLGFPMGVSGGELTQRAVIQAQKFGANLTAPCTAVSLRNHAGHLVVRLSDGSDVAGRSVIAATGAAYRRLDAARLSEFEDNGVYYAATEMEARMCGTAPVVVVGGGNSAGQAAIFLSQGGCAVTLVIRGSDLGASMSRYLEQRIDADPGITVPDTYDRRRPRRGPDAAGAAPEGPRRRDGRRLRRAVLLHRRRPVVRLALRLRRGRPTRLRAHRPLVDAEQLGEGWAALDRLPLPFETSHPGLFAVGDLRSGSTKRVAAAVGEGSSSVRSVHQYLAFSS